MAQGETGPGAKGAVQLLSASANANLADKVAAALARAGYRVDRGPFDPERKDAVVVLWTQAALEQSDLVAAARKAFEARRLTPLSIGGVEPPFGSADMEPMNLAGWRGEDNDPRWRFVLSDIEELKTRGRLEDAPIGPVQPSAPEVSSAPQKPAETEAPAEAPLVAQRPSLAARPAAKPEPPVAVNDLFAEDTPDPHHPARNLWRNHVLPAAPFLVGAAAILGLAAGASYVFGVFEPASLTAAEDRTQQPSPASTGTSPDESAPQAPSGETTEPVKEDRPPALGLVRLAPGETAAGGASAPLAVPLPIDPPAEELAEQDIPEAEQQSAEDDGLAETKTELLALLEAPSLKPEAPLDAQEGESEEGLLENPPYETYTADAEGLNEAALSQLEAAVRASDQALAQAYRGGFFSDCENCPDMAALNGGAFLMGASPDEAGAEPVERPQRRVDIGYRFAIATRETTFDQWMACVEDGGCRAYFPYDEEWGRGQRPVIYVSYEDASAYARWLSAKTGRHYRLPSEAEWEFAARAGANDAFSFGNRISSLDANFDGRRPYRAEPSLFREQTVPVTGFEHNAFGLFDMHGNVAEWTLDCWAPGHDGSPSTGAARIDGDCSKRVVKGGAWSSPGADLRAAHRTAVDGEARSASIGFRVVRTLD